MDLKFLINGVPFKPGEPASAVQLRQADLNPVGGLQRLARRLPRGYRYWESTDPHVECFDGDVAIYPCLDGYLNHDRRWGTSCLVRTVEQHLAGIEIWVIDGVYAAGNLYDRFIDAGREHLGIPLEDGRSEIRWHNDRLLISAHYDRHQYNAVFRVELQPA